MKDIKTWNTAQCFKRDSCFTECQPTLVCAAYSELNWENMDFDGFNGITKILVNQYTSININTFVILSVK